MKHIITAVKETAKLAVQVVKENKLVVVKGSTIVVGTAIGITTAKLLNRAVPNAPTETFVPDPVTDID